MKGSDICRVDNTLYNITVLEDGFRISFLYEEDFTPIIFTVKDGEVQRIESFDGPEGELNTCSVDTSFETRVLGALDAYLEHQSNSSSE